MTNVNLTDEFLDAEKEYDENESTQNIPDKDNVTKNIEKTQGLKDISHIDKMLYKDINLIDVDNDYSFDINSNNYNRIIEISSSILSVALEVRKIKSFEEEKNLYVRIRDEIDGVSEEIKTLGYDNSVQLSFRYCLCSFLDEAVMSTDWGSSSIWSNKSMLSHFHDETWGGEKFFQIISRTMTEPEKYRDLLEFLYLCLALGFKGQYGIEKDGKESIQKILKKLQKILRELRGGYSKSLTKNLDISKRQYKLDKLFPIWGVWGISALILGLIYFLYDFSLTDTTGEVLDKLDKILKK